MPLPKPNENETEDDFISRCMGNETMQEEYPDEEQRYAVCITQWSDRNKTGAAPKQHPHGEHICVCPECGKEITVGEDIKCNTQRCPECGTQMRAKETGDRRQAMQNIERKTFTGIELKADKPGSFTARIATLNVIDKDGDVTLPGAFPADKTILISAYMHGSWMGELPVGKGVIIEKGEEVLVEGEFNLNTETGKEHYETLKFAPDLSEWSYGYLVLAVDEDSEWNDNPKVYRVLKQLDVFEASPVLRGAGVNTALLAIKNDKMGTTYADHMETVLAAVTDLVDRTKSLADLRRKEGRDLSPTNLERIAGLRKAIDELASELDQLAKAEPENQSEGEGKKALESLKRIYNELQEVIKQ